MKYNKLIKTLSCLIFFVFIINTSMAQQNVVNTDNSFPNGTIVASENGTIRAKLKMSANPYDEYMVGVFSDNKNVENNAMVKVNPVMTGGITFVKCNAENGVVKKGDLITSSSIPGVGMKATKTGMVIGLALEDAQASTDLVKVRVFIQYVKQ